MITIINHLNRILTKGKLILHAEPSTTAIKAIHRIDYTLYIFKKNEDKPFKVWSCSRTLNAGNPMSDLDDEITEEILRFVLRGGLQDYE